MKYLYPCQLPQYLAQVLEFMPSSTWVLVLNCMIELHDRTFSFDAAIQIIKRSESGIVALEQSGVNV